MANQGGSHEQHVKAGQQSHKNQDKDQQQASAENMRQQDGKMRQQEGGGSRGGTHEQHVRAGEQSHKNR